jgi:hypothetical protein
MPTPGFPAGTLTEGGFPAWIMGLADEDPNHTVHVVRDLAPTEAMQVLGAKPGMIAPCQLPAQRPDRVISLPRAAIAPTDSGSVLLAGQIGVWTFIYDDMGLTAFMVSDERQHEVAPPAKMLSVGGREAATSTWTIDADTNLAYAVDGELLLEVGEDLEAAQDDIPAGLHGAVEAAGHFESGDGDEFDSGINMRVLCALAGLNARLDDLRHVPLLAAPFS